MIEIEIKTDVAISILQNIARQHPGFWEQRALEAAIAALVEKENMQETVEDDSGKPR